MQRRTFLSNAVSASLAAGLAAPHTAPAQTPDRNAFFPDPALPPNAIGQPATDAYFSDAHLHKALATSTLLEPQVKVIAYNFPSWHPSPFMEARFGKDWTEFDTLRNARSLFPSHTMPHYPLWGYYNEADPAWAAREIELAANHHVDAWIIDWYWHNGQQFYQEQIEQGLLKAPNRDKIQFAIMWANHDWKNVYPARSPDEAAILLPQLHSLQDFENVASYCAEHYFSQPNYLRIDAAPLFALFDAAKVVHQLGLDGLREALTRFRTRCASLGFPDLHLQACSGYSKLGPDLHAIGFNSVTSYGTTGWTYGAKPPGSRIPYGVVATEAIAQWSRERASVSVPYFPCAQVGWDDSPRFEQFSAIAINRSPDQFERLVRAARHTLAPVNHPKLIYIAAWNEWTEDHVLLPDTTWGYSYLEALRRAVS